MINLPLPRARDLIGAVIVAAFLAALLVYRAYGVEPREFGALCAQASAPLVCAPRAALLWMQYEYLWGALGLALGLWAFIGAPFGVTLTAVALGAAGVVNYNATWGMVGLALGVWAWIRPRRVLSR